MPREMSEFAKMASIPFEPLKGPFNDVDTEVKMRMVHATEYIAQQLYDVCMVLDRIADKE